MPFEIPEDLNPALMSLAWLIGRWEGRGHGDYPTIDAFEFGQQIEFRNNGDKPYLYYVSQTYKVAEDGTKERPLAMESGFWRPQPDGEIEVMLSHPTGIIEIYEGTIEPAKIEIRTDVVARTSTAKEVNAGHRLYGLVNGDLMWAYDMAAVGQPLQPHIWATLKRI